MINIITVPSSSSSRKALSWMREHKLPFREYKINNNNNNILNECIIKKLLNLSDFGFDSIVSYRSSRLKELGGKHWFQSLSTAQAIQTIIDNPRILRYPLIFADKKLQIGYQADGIRQFIPSQNREDELLRLMGPNYHKTTQSLIAHATEQFYHVVL